MIGSLHHGEISRRRTSQISLWMLGLTMSLTGISCLNWNFVAASQVGKWVNVIVFRFETHLKLHREILDYSSRTNCRCFVIRASLAMYSPLTWLTTSEESNRTSSPVTPSVVVIRSPARTASYSASLMEAGKPRVKDCSMIDPFGVVRTTLMSALMLFEAPSIFRIHPSTKWYCSAAPRVKSGIKFAKFRCSFQYLPRRLWVLYNAS